MASYLDSTSWVKNNCNGQSTEYSRAIPSQPSREISEEALGIAAPGFPSPYALVLGKSSWEDLTEIPNEGILIDVETTQIKFSNEVKTDSQIVKLSTKVRR